MTNPFQGEDLCSSSADQINWSLLLISNPCCHHPKGRRNYLAIGSSTQSLSEFWSDSWFLVLVQIQWIWIFSHIQCWNRTEEILVLVSSLVFFVFWAFYEIALSLSYMLVLPCLNSNENPPCTMSVLLTASCTFESLDSWIHMSWCKFSFQQLFLNEGSYKLLRWWPFPL